MSNGSGPSCGRRDFIKLAGAAAAAGCLPLRALAGESAASAGPRVAVATAGEYAGRSADVPAEVVVRLVEAAVTAAAGAPDAASAWKSLVKPSDRVAVKVNAIAGARLSTHPSIAAAVLDGLLFAGVPAANIVVFDRSSRELERAGYRVGADARGVRFIGTDDPAVGYGDTIVTSGAVGSLMSKVVTDFATAIVNLPVLKDHDLSGVSLGMKNFFGVIHNPNKYHDNGCDPYIADLSACPLLAKRLRLVLVDGLFAQYDGGPAYNPAGGHVSACVIAGTDPVAVDRVGWEEIETLRREKGLKSLKSAGREPRHILTAASRGLGAADLSKVQLLRVAL